MASTSINMEKIKMGKTFRRTKDYWEDDPYQSKWKKQKKKLVKKSKRNRKLDNDESREHGIHYR